MAFRSARAFYQPSNFPPEPGLLLGSGPTERLLRLPALVGAATFPAFAMPYPASLLLTPDTSGFTAFVHETELEHSQYIISGLLNALI